MRSRSMVLLGLALGCGLVASIGISQVMDRRNTGDAPVGEMEPILIASANIRYNDLLTPEVVRFEEWPKGKVPPGALTKLDELQGKRSAMKIIQGEPILTGKLMGNDGVGAAGKIPAGYRVVSVAVDAVTGASSLIEPNDRVDVLLYMSRKPQSSVEEMSTRTILHDVRVFAVDRQFERANGNGEPAATAAKTVSLLVTPEEAEKVTLANGMGQIRLVMRSPDDSTHTESTGASVSDILGKTAESEAAARAQAQAAATATVAPAQQPGSQTEAPAPQPMARNAPPANWTMILVEGSDMHEVELSADKQFPVIIRDRVDYEPDPPTQPAAPVETPDTSSDDSPTLTQPTAGDEGFGDPQEAGPND